MTPEQKARVSIDALLVQEGWHVCDVADANIMPLPPRTEQARIVAEVDHHLSIIREVEAGVDANLQRAQALRQSVLSKVFCGDKT
jgi:hypothetical protein